MHGWESNEDDEIFLKDEGMDRNRMKIVWDMKCIGHSPGKPTPWLHLVSRWSHESKT